MMKYMLMMNVPGGGPYQIGGWPRKDIEAHIAFMKAFATRLADQGELVGAEGLSGPEALIAAAAQWPRDGVPDNARGWLLKVATRRLTDQIRADTARRLREQLVVSLVPADEQIAHAADAASDRDDTLDLYFMCCHPALSDSPMVRLSRAIALAMVDGPVAGLRALDSLAADPVLRDHYRVAAARGHLHERAGNRDHAVAHYRKAADSTTSTAERHYLLLRAARLAER